MTKQKRGKRYDYPHLVGNTGDICWDNRLYPLRMNRKYKNVLEAVERNRKSKITQIFQGVEQYWKVCDLLLSLKRENKNDCNSAMIMELEERKLTVRKKLINLKSKADFQLPEALNKSTQKIFNRNSKPERKKMTSSFATRKTLHSNTNEIHNFHVEKNLSQKTSFHGCLAVNNISDPVSTCLNRGNWAGSVKSQIFVRRSNSEVVAISIDLFSTGKDLVHVLTQKFGEDINKYSIIFGTNELDMNKTLFKQEIYHGTTVDLNARLRGGVGKKKNWKKKQRQMEQKDLRNNAETESPEFWNKKQVTEWIVKICQELEIEENEVSLLKGQNGKALNDLPKEDWIRRSPNHGDTFFNNWQQLKEKLSRKKQEAVGNADVDPVNLEEFSTKETSLSMKSRNDDFIDKSSHDIGPKMNETSSTTSPSGAFGKVQNIGTTGNLMLLEHLSNDGISPTPEIGSVVSVTGICAGTQGCIDNVGALFIRDEPRGASSVFHKMKVVICSDKTSGYLQPFNVDKLLKEIRTGMHVAVKGRVDRLNNEDDDDKEPHSEMIRFKLVVDSDNHSLVYVEKQKPQYTRQLSQPWWIQEAGDTSFSHLNLKAGDLIAKTPQRVFCESTTSDDEIMNYVVAFKNCRDGHIFVGVDKSGVVTGRKFGVGKNAWLEKLSKAIGTILPDSGDGAAMCSNLEEACQLVCDRKCFVCVLHLPESGKNEADRKSIGWIYVPKGDTDPIYFRKPKDVESFIRKGAENKRITNYKELFSSLSSLGSRRKPRQIPEEDLNIDTKFKEAIGETGLQNNYKVLQPVRCENEENELKMIFGADPIKTIVDKYLTDYTCGFLNASGGNILFGVQEEEKSKLGHIVGIAVPQDKRKELVQKAVTSFSKFYPPVSKSQFRIIFHKVTVPTQLIVKNSQSEDDTEKFVILCGPSEEIGKKWPKFVKEKLKDCLCRVIPLQPQRFCIVVENQDDIPDGFFDMLSDFIKQNSKITKDSTAANNLKTLFKDLCIIELKVFPPQYPIYMIKPIETHVVDKEGNIIKLSIEKLMRRFELGVDSRTRFDVDKFLNHVENFQLPGNSFILIASPFDLATTERDLHGLVLPQWTLAIDFDQNPKQEGHLFHRFKELNDIHQLERERFIKTPLDKKLGLNPEHAICWLAARGYVEIEKTLSKEGHGNWNMTHREQLRSLLKAELTSCVKPNYLNIVVLWDDGYQSLVDSLRTILEDILSINGHRTAVTFVCSTQEVKLEISESLVEPLQKDYWKIITSDRVYVAPPYVLSRHLSNKLPSPYQSEDDYQVPHKKKYRGKDQIFPDIMPQQLRHNISSYMKMIYMKNERSPDQSTFEKERKKFYSGLEITDLCLRRKVAIEREKMEELEKEFKVLTNDRRSHVSMLCLKVDRGAGSSTLCLQFLYKHHEEYPCAQLLRIDDKLLSYIKDINNATKLPLLLFVDEEISHPQEFLDFTKKLVIVNVILLLIEPAEACGIKGKSPKKTMNSTRMKSVTDSSTLRTWPFKVVELRRELTEKEMRDLTVHLTNIKNEKKTSEKLEKLIMKAKLDKGLRTYAHFGLTAFGKDFLALKQFVKFRINMASDKQKTILSFLSLIHIYTDSHLPASALSGFLETIKTVDLEVEFQNDYLRELLSPPADNEDSRRICFHEVAEEILKQLASEKTDGINHMVTYWQFVKDVSVDLAKHVLSVNISTRSINGLTKRLFVTSEYESEKFSSLIRAMKDAKLGAIKDTDLDIARDTLSELVNVFENHSSFRAHIRAHLAKYYMIVAKNFEKAKPLIEEAIKDQQDDSLLQHIHGDIIRLHVQALKKKPDNGNDNVKMDTIVLYAIESSDSFAVVRRKRPYDSHGYMSDAIVRITVMQAAIKKQTRKDSDSFVDYLIEMLDEIRERGDRITEKERYLLSLIPDAHRFLYEGVSDDFEQKEKWKVNFRDCIGALSNLRRLCDKLREQKTIFCDFRDDNSIWLHEVLLSIQTLNNGFEIERKNLTREQIEERIMEIEECALGLKCPEPLMKFWIRYSRDCKNVPHLTDVKKRVKEWMITTKKKNRTSPSAEFYNYVVNVLIALQDPNDREKRKKVEKLQQGKKFKKDNVVVPQEWLHPKDGHHINSIDSLLHHEELVKAGNGTYGSRMQPPGREVIEGYLKEKEITKWTGTVTSIKELWLGTITFKNHFEVRFIPQSVQTSMPQEGETVSFCLAFDRLGLSAWWVRHEDRSGPLDMVKTYVESDRVESSSDEENSSDELTTTRSIFDSNSVHQVDRSWDSHNGKRLQGVVFSTNPVRGFGYIKHPDIPGTLFFHALQLVEPVITLKGTIEKPMVLEFNVEKIKEKTRAVNIHVVKPDKVEPKIAAFRKVIEQNSSPSTSRRDHKEPSNSVKPSADTQARETGVVLRHSKDGTFGFIRSDNKSRGKELFFHLRCLVVKGSLPGIGKRVQFSVVKTEKGLEANSVCLALEHPPTQRSAPVSVKKWSQLIGCGIQEGFVESISDDQGFIASKYPSNPAGLLRFYYKDIQNRDSQVYIENCKVHFEVNRRGGKLIAVNINIIGSA